MKAVQWRLVLVVLVLAGVLAGCGAGKSGDTGEVVLKVSGMVNKEMGWSEADLKAMDTAEAEYTDKSGETKTYTGVPVNALLEKTGLKGTAVVFVAADGYSAEATVDEVKGCVDCIVAFGDEDSLSMVMPGFSSKLQVKDVVEIQVK